VHGTHAGIVPATTDRVIDLVFNGMSTQTVHFCRSLGREQPAQAANDGQRETMQCNEKQSLPVMGN